MVIFDGTLWQDDAMVRAGLSQKARKRMDHMPMSGPERSIVVFADLGVAQQSFAHMNKANSVLRAALAPAHIGGSRQMQDHDRTDTNEGGIERWLRPADAVGLDRDNVASKVGILPATLFAVDAYVRLVRDRSLHKAVAACLTKLFAAAIRAARIEGLLAN